MLLSQNLRKGTVYVHNSDPWLVLGYWHIKSARGSATIRVRIQNLKTGVIKEDTYKSSEKFEEAAIENKNIQFLYSDDTNVYFMDPDTYEQISFDKEPVTSRIPFLKEGDSYQLLMYEGQLIDINIPKTMSYKIIYTEPGFKGDTSANTLKPAKLENGIDVQVPLFINIGDVIKINTDTLTYKERA